MYIYRCYYKSIYIYISTEGQINFVATAREIREVVVNFNRSNLRTVYTCKGHMYACILDIVLSG